MGQGSVLRSPKKEEQQDTYHGIETLDELKGFLGINNIEDDEEDEDYKPQEQIWMNNYCEEHDEFLGWDFTSSNREAKELFPKDEERGESFNFNFNSNFDIDHGRNNNVKREDYNICGFWDVENNAVEERKASLHLNLNYEEVLEAWSNRPSLQAHHHHHHPSFSMSNHDYLGEVPNLEEERTRRETSVLRYKKKRQSRLFSKKIRYEVRKLNADKRPRLKGRFVRRIPDSR